MKNLLVIELREKRLLIKLEKNENEAKLRNQWINFEISNFLLVNNRSFSTLVQVFYDLFLISN